MSVLFFLFSRTVNAFFIVLMFAMLGRAFSSLLMMDEDGFIASLLYVVTEPAIYPVRAICEKFGWFEGSVIDMPFLISFFVISAVQTLVSELM